ncbi:MAG: AMP-binding protein [Bacteroidales bacterium]|nr:AMP-binding protein [Bacteroidales bacterium]
MTYPLSQSQLSIFLACQGLNENDGNYQQASLYRLPDSVDIERLTYAELDRLSDNLAAEINKTVKPGGVVSIILGRNEHMVITPVAAIKAGCTYQPLDPTYPSERLGYMVQDSRRRKTMWT